MDQYIGKLLDNRYEILEVVGTGGMARVYKARCHRLNRLVAIKILREDLSQDAEFRRRFHDESQAIAMLSHPNIVAVYDVSRSSELEYIVMELIDGITLKQYMQRKGNKLNWREALHFIIQITKALGHAHSRGIIHRDIKPHNIMVLRDGSVKVSDFGIARLASSGHSTLTQEALGSVHYISPEQARGSHIDARSDLYSAGVVLYEMITGRLPFEGDTPVSVAIQHINSIPLSPREIDPTIPEALEAITMKAMAPNPDNRYSSADEMLADLEEFRKNPNLNLEYKAVEFTPDVEELENLDPERTRIRSVSTGTRERSHPSGQSAGSRHPRREVAEPSGGQVWPIVLAVAAVLVFLGGILYFLYHTMISDFFTPPASYVVPSLTGMTYEQAMQDEELLGHFQLVLGETVEDDAEAGTILSQDPAANTEVGESDTEITVNISSGQELVEMIDLTNMEYLKAFLALDTMGLDYATPTYEYSSSVAKDHIISYTPLVGTRLPKGYQVQMVISKGPETKSVTLISFVGQTQEKAENDIRTMNLEVGDVIPVYDDEVEAGKVVSQFPLAGTEVEQGTSVNLQISQGPDPSTQPQPPSEVINTVSIPLPDTGEEVRLTVMVDGAVVWNEMYDTDMELAADVELTATAGTTKNITYYYDGVLANSFSHTFE
jgi:serine/threonine-protein kinase